MSSIPTNESDIVGWTQEYLALRRVADLKKLIDRLHLKFPDVGDESRPPARRLNTFLECSPLFPRARLGAGSPLEPPLLLLLAE